MGASGIIEPSYNLARVVDPTGNLFGYLRSVSYS